MSIRWVSDRVGYDGDLMHGDVTVNYWIDRADFEGQMDKQIAEMRDRMLAERDRLMADES